MVIITINVPEIDLKFLDALTATGFFPSRSEAVRHCIRFAAPLLSEQAERQESYIQLTKKEIKEFNKSQDKVVLVPNSRYATDFTSYNIVKRLD